VKVEFQRVSLDYFKTVTSKMQLHSLFQIQFHISY